MKIEDNNRCFICGQDNNKGFKLKFVQDKSTGTASVSLKIPDYFQGYKDITHGGIIASLLDEVMVKAIGCKVLTVELNVKFLKPVPTESEVQFFGKKEKIIKKIAIASSSVRDIDGNILSTATGKYYCLEDSI